MFDRSLRCSKWPAELELEYVVGDIADSRVCNPPRGSLGNLGGVRHVICAAGIGSGKFGFHFWNLEPADWPRVLEVNVMGMVKTPLNESVWAAGQEQLLE